MKKLLKSIFIAVVFTFLTGVAFADNYFVPNLPGKKFSSEGSTSSFKFEKQPYDDNYETYLYIKNKNTSKVFGKKSVKILFNMSDVKDLFYTLIAIRNKELYFVADGENPDDVRRLAHESMQEMGYVNRFDIREYRARMYVLPIIKNGIPIIIFRFVTDGTNANGATVSDELWIVDSKKLDSIIKDLGRIREQIYKKYNYK